MKQITRYSENRIADVIKETDTDVQFSHHNTIPSILLSGAEWTE